MKHYCDEHSSRIYAPALRKGDVLFWNSRTIHGSMPTRDDGFSRKSLTAHFLPADLGFGNLFATKDRVAYRVHDGRKYFANQPEYSTKSMVLARIKSLLYNRPHLLRVARKLQRRSISDWTTKRRT